jgi:uncharacterized protein (TIGR03067 family)
MRSRRRLCLLGLTLALALLCLWLTPLPRQDWRRVASEQPVEPVKAAGTLPIETAFEQIWRGMPEEELFALMAPYEEWNTGHHQWRHWSEGTVEVFVTLWGRVTKRSMKKEVFDSTRGQWAVEIHGDARDRVTLREERANRAAVPVDPWYELDDVLTETAPLAGKWEVIGGRLQGDGLPLERMQFVFKDGKLTWWKDNHVALRQSYKIDPKKNPKTIDLFDCVFGDRFKDGTWEGIYRIDGNRLKICLPVDIGARERPKEFKAGMKSNSMVLILKRDEG